jgi:hypothetical protein
MHGNHSYAPDHPCWWCRWFDGVISLLRSYGADPKAKNKFGVSPLELAGTIANYAIARHFNDVADSE